MLRKINKKGSLVLRHLISSGMGHSSLVSEAAYIKSSGKFLATHRFYSTEKADVENNLIRNIGIIAHIDAVSFIFIFLL